MTLRCLAPFAPCVVLLIGCSGASDERENYGSDAGHDAAAPDADSGLDANAQGTPAPGTVTEIGSCDPGTLPATTCTRLTVSCPNTTDLGVAVRITTPSAAVRGTVVLGSGGGGDGYFDGGAPEAALLTSELISAGFVVVQRAWDTPGWFAGAAGMHPSSCRYATLLKWIDEQHLSQKGPFCALGVSGGAIEISYALSRWDAADRLSAAILLSGPSISQLDRVCPSVAPSSWVDTGCPALASKYGVTSCGPLVCTLSVQGAAQVVDSAWAPNHPCTVAADANLQKLALDGSVSPDMRRAYPQTKVAMAIGSEECAATPLVYYDAITTERSIEIVAGAAHGIYGTAGGDAAVRAMFKASCADY